MSQFKRFNSSDNTNWNTNDAYPAGTLTWDPDNGLRVHDGNTSGGNSVGGTGYTRFLGRGIGSYNNGSVYDMTISPNWDGDFTGYSYINIPSNENFGSPLQIVQNNTGGVQIITENNATWEFKADGDLVLPSEGGIVRYNGEGYSSVLFSGDYNDLINKPDVSDLTDTTGLLGGGSGSVGYEIKSADFTAEAGKTYWLDSGTSAKTVTLPASPSTGDWVKIYDGSLNWTTYNLTVSGNGNQIRTVDMMAGQTWGTAASTATLNQSAISPTGPLASSFVWNGTHWYGAA